MKKLLFLLPLLLSAEVNPFDIKISKQNQNLLTPQEKAILENRQNIEDLQKKVNSLQKTVNEINFKLLNYDETLTKLQSFNTLLDEVSTAKADIDLLKKDMNVTKIKVQQLEENLTAIQKTLKHIVTVQKIQNRNIQNLKQSIKILVTELKQKQLQQIQHTPDMPPKEAMQKAKDFYEKGELDKSRELFLYTLSKKYLPATSAYYLGEIAFKKGQYDQALGYYKKSVEFYPKKTSFTDQLLYHTAISFQKLGNNEAAKLTFKKLINDFPNSKYAALAKKELAKLK